MDDFVEVESYTPEGTYHLSIQLSDGNLDSFYAFAVVVVDPNPKPETQKQEITLESVVVVESELKVISVNNWGVIEVTGRGNFTVRVDGTEIPTVTLREGTVKEIQLNETVQGDFLYL